MGTEDCLRIIADNLRCPYGAMNSFDKVTVDTPGAHQLLVNLPYLRSLCKHKASRQGHKKSMGLLVRFGFMYYYTSTLRLSNRSSFCVLIGKSNLEVSFALNMLSALIWSVLSYSAMPLVEQPTHQRYVHPGPLVLGADPLKFPNVRTGYKPNCLTTF